jgi:hypothetical protein
MSDWQWRRRLEHNWTPEKHFSEMLKEWMLTSTKEQNNKLFLKLLKISVLFLLLNRCCWVFWSKRNESIPMISLCSSVKLDSFVLSTLIVSFSLALEDFEKLDLLKSWRCWVKENQWERARNTSHRDKHKTTTLRFLNPPFTHGWIWNHHFHSHVDTSDTILNLLHLLTLITTST